MSSPEPPQSGASQRPSGIEVLRDWAPVSLVNLMAGNQEEEDADHVEHFKYTHHLERKLTVTSIIGLGFTLMGVPFGLSSTLWISLVDGGNVTMLYGWLIVGFFSICVVLSLSEIISRYPTSGGVYHFSAILSNERYSLISSWFTGWFLLIGNWTYAVSILFSGSQFIISIFGLKDVYYKEDIMLVLAVYFCLLTFVGFINFKFSNYLVQINKICIIWSVGTVILVDVLLIVFSKQTNSASHTLGTFDNSRSGWPDPIAFMVGLQSSSFTLTGYGMLFSMTDEVRNPEKNMPKGAVSAICMSVLQGLMFIIPILIIMPELTVLLDSSQEIMPIDLIFKTATQSYVVSFLLTLLLVGTVLFQAIGSVTTASRSTYAFARDGGLPFKDFWLEVEAMDETTVPKNALILSMVVCGIFSLLALISSSAFNAFMGASVVSLALANGIPIFCSMLNKRQKIRGAPFRLRKLGWLINGISVVWVCLSFVILCMPPVIRNLRWNTMNYASVVLVFLALLAAVGFRTWGRNVFTGPLIDNDYLELGHLGTKKESKAWNPVSTVDPDEEVDDHSPKTPRKPHKGLLDLSREESETLFVAEP